MKKLLAILLLGSGAACALGPDPLFDEIDQIVAELARISGLTQLRKIEYARIEKDRVKAYLEERVKESVKPEEIRSEEISLKKLGFVPQDFDLKKTTIEMLSEQAAAFYDFRKKKLFLIDANPDMLQHSALVHELAHALADQHFHLDKFIDRASKNDDTSLARMAVMEGQATWLMSEYLTRRTGQSLMDSPVLLKLMARSTEVSSGQYPIFDRAPLYLKETLLFPYAQGLLFQHAAVEKLGKAGFSEVFRRPPVSTQQVLHPERYFAADKPARPALPQTARHYSTFTDGELGELDHSVLLRQYAGEAEASELSPAWRGGVYRLLEDKKDHRMILEYASEWSSAETAARFFGFYRKVLQGKWKTFQISAETERSIAGRGDDGYFLVRQDGTRVTSLEGLPEPQDALH